MSVVSTRGATIRSLAVAFPETVRTNDFWRRNHPEMVASAEERILSKVFAVSAGGGDRARELSTFEREMLPYLSDPFRGTVERRVLGDEDPVSAIEAPSARAAIEGAGLRADGVQLLVSCAFPSAQPGVGDASFLARALGLRGAAWNVESACASGLVGFDVATAMVQAGRYDRVLVVTSGLYSRVTEVTDSSSWTIGDGAAAFVVTPCELGDGVLAIHNVHTGDTCDALRYDLVVEGERAAMRMRAQPGAGESLRDSAETSVDECCRAVCDAAGVRLSQVDAFVCNTPTAWFASFFAKKMGVDRERVVDTYPRYANMGPALWPTALHQAASEGRLRRGDLVLLYAIGSVSSASAALVRWGDVALGPPPPPPRIRQ